MRSKIKILNLIDNKTTYENKEDLVNYVSDIYILPHIKNNLMSVLASSESESISKNKIINTNKMDKSVNLYLNSLKIKYQKEKDEMNYDNKYKNLKVIGSRIDEVYTNCYQNTRDYFDYVFDFDCGNYLIYKYDNYNKIGITEGKEREVIKNMILKDYKKNKSIKFMSGFINSIIKNQKHEDNDEF